jgi:hypothetical protein
MPLDQVKALRRPGWEGSKSTTQPVVPIGQPPR